MTQLITSERSKTFRRLTAIRKRPKAEGKLLLEGEAMRRQLEKYNIAYTLYGKEGEDVDAEVFFQKGLFERLATTVTPQSFLIEVDIPQEKAFDAGCVLVLDRIQDPGNLGTILRTAESFGISNILSLKGSVSWTNEKVLRSSLGSILALKICEDAVEADLKELKAKGYHLLGADMSGEDIRSFKAPEKWALVIGNEGSGLSSEVRANLDYCIRIPMKEGMESLNAAVAASILMFSLAMK